MARIANTAGNIPPLGTTPKAADVCQPPPRTVHALHYRFSTSLFGRRFYMAVLAGTETRSTHRLRDEGILRSFGAVAAELAIICLAISLMICLLTGFAVIGLYLVKSALGIDLIAGPSSLHPLYELLFGH